MYIGIGVCCVCLYNIYIYISKKKNQKQTWIQFKNPQLLPMQVFKIVQNAKRAISK